MIGARKHRAPNGALRPHFNGSSADDAIEVRKHRAPNGALRLLEREIEVKSDSKVSESTERQKVH